MAIYELITHIISILLIKKYKHVPACHVLLNLLNFHPSIFFLSNTVATGWSLSQLLTGSESHSSPYRYVDRPSQD